VAVSAVMRMVDLHRRQLFGLTEVRGVGRLQKFYERSRTDLERKLTGMVRAGKGQTFGAQHLRQVLAQVSATVRELQGEIAEHLDDTGGLAAKLAPRHLVGAVETLEKHFGGLAPVLQPSQAAVFQRAYRGQAPSLLDHFKRSSELYGPPVVKKIRDELTLSMLQGEGVDEAVDRVAGTDGVFAKQRWRAERIVRTEVSYAYGVSNQVGMAALKAQVPRLMKRLVETIDNRTGEDSIELNGQTVDVDKPFRWVVKNSRGVPTGKVVEYFQPPNRPQDRAVTIPWLASWPASPQLDDAGPVRPRVPGL